MMNYAGLRQERDHLTKNITQFDVGFGQKLFMSCLGEGRPTVILDAPTGATSDVWLSGQLQLASVTRVCVYDRAGLGWSEPAPRLNMSDPGEAAVARTLGPEATGLKMVSDLHRLVTFAHPQERPLVLVGAELGGLVARLYSHLHKEDLAHLVMIDPISETLFSDVSNLNDAERTENPWLGYWYGSVLPSLRLLQVAAMTGLARLGLIFSLTELPHTHTEESRSDLDQAKLKHQLCDPFHIQAVIDEHRNMNETLSQLAEVSSSAAFSLSEAEVPSTVISGAQFDQHLAPGLNRGWSRAVQDVIQRTGSKHIVISEGDRRGLLTGDLVTEVIAPVIRIVKNWRQQHSS